MDHSVNFPEKDHMPAGEWEHFSKLTVKRTTINW